MYSVLVGDDFKLSRDQLAAALRAQQIDSRPFFLPMHILPAYAAGQSLPVAERLARQGLNLPSSTTLSEAQIERVAAAIIRASR